MDELQKPKIIADNRELKSPVCFWLKERADIEFAQLDVGDYILSERVGVERKRVPDFLASILSQRVFDQLERLKRAYQKPVLVIEGQQEQIWHERNLHPNTIKGVLAAIAIDLSMPMIWSASPKETAEILGWIAYREQIKEKRKIAVRPGKRRSEIKEEQEFLIAGLPGISTVRARELLRHFKTPRRVFLAKEKQLNKVKGIGKKTIDRILQILDTEYH
ncbi:MAG: ERCC4 domain-containing protein [Candidatus Aenigmatarchaeota archaeon]